MMRFLGIGAAALITLGMLGAANTAQAAGENRAEGAPPEQLLLPPLRVPVADDEFDHHLTLYIKLEKQTHLYAICRRVPKIFEEITFYVNRKKLKNLPKDTPAYMPKLSKALLGRVQRAVGKQRKIDEIFVFLGALDIESGPHTTPEIPHPVDCERVIFRAKSIAQ